MNTLSEYTFVYIDSLLNTPLIEFFSKDFSKDFSKAISF